MLDVGRRGCWSSRPSGVSSAISRPSRISSSRSQREASSITWLDTSTRGPRLGEAVEGPPQLDAQHRVEADRGLVEDEQVGLAEQGDGQRHPGPLSAREPADDAGPRGRRARRSRRTRATRSLADPEDPGEEAQVLGDGEVVVDAGLLGDVADPVCAGTPTPAGSPNTSTAPEVIRCTPTRPRISVVLPHPDGPSRPVTWPAATPKSRSRRTSCAAAGDAEAAHRPPRYSSCDELSTASPRVKRTNAQSGRSPVR